MSRFDFASSLELRSSGWAFYRWAVTTVFVAFYTWFFYYMEQVSPQQTAIQLSFALMCGATSLCLVWFVDILNRRVWVDDGGIKTRFIFQSEKRFYWDEIAYLIWWNSGKKMTNYRLLLADGLFELALDTVTWRQSSEAFRWAAYRSKITPQNMANAATKIWFKNAVSAALIVLGFSLSTFVKESEVVHAVGFLIVRVFWARFLIGRPSLNWNTTRGYMFIFTVATLLGLIFIAPSNLLDLAGWWLYTPLIDILLSYLYQRVKPIFSRSSSQVL